MATNINTILSWFKTGKKPTQKQFWDAWQSFWHKDEQIPQSSVANLVNTLDEKAEKTQFEAHQTDEKAHADLLNLKEDKARKGLANGYAPLDASGKLRLNYLYAANDLTSGGTQVVLTAEQGKILQNTKLTATMATDSETQITGLITEDVKVVSRLKLFNWWEWIRSKKILLKSIQLQPGTTTESPLIIPNGILTTTPQEGAIERDANGILWETHGGVRTQITATRFTKNIDPTIGTSLFAQENLVAGSVIPAATSTGQGKIYPYGLKSSTNMEAFDIIESSFLMHRETNPPTANYTLRFEFWKTVTAKGTPVVHRTYNYSWNSAEFRTLPVKIIMTKNTNMTELGYILSYVVLINGVFAYSTFNFFTNDDADCRLFLVNNAPETHNINITQIQATNLFIPRALSL
ncbi:hypothetical protein [Flavobacterium poyangense]|uniref:hypothetical protein n=1 Tax=Flavobacterium poyangense TaxID=2204302 RepID=UPI00141F7FFC|nr:hypothetical protein [Flavobacterium sp. JXAS1]